MKLIILYDAYARRIFALLALVCALSAFAYGFFLLEAVAHTAARARATQEVKAMRTLLSHAETSYLSIAQTLTPARAAEMGFGQPVRVSTVYATDSSLLTFSSGLR